MQRECERVKGVNLRAAKTRKSHYRLKKSQNNQQKKKLKNFSIFCWKVPLNSGKIQTTPRQKCNGDVTVTSESRDRSTHARPVTPKHVRSG